MVKNPTIQNSLNSFESVKEIKNQNNNFLVQNFIFGKDKNINCY